MVLRAEASGPQRLGGIEHSAGLASDAEDAWMSLADAAESLRGSQRGSDLDCISRGLSGSDDDLLAFWARRVAESGVPIYGSRIMASRPEVIPIEAIRTGTLVHRASRLDPGRGQPIQDICALCVKRADLHRHLAGARHSAAA